MLCESLRSAWVLMSLILILVMFFSGLRLSALLKPGRSTFPNLLRRADVQPEGQKWYTLGIVLLGVGALLVVGFGAFEYFICGAR